MRSLRRIYGVSLADRRIRNEEIHRTEIRMAKKIYDDKVSGKRDRGRPQLIFKNTVSFLCAPFSLTTHSVKLEENKIKKKNYTPKRLVKCMYFFIIYFCNHLIIKII